MKKPLAFCLSAAMICSTLSGCAVQKTTLAYTVYPVGFLIDRLKTDDLISVSIQDDSIVQRAQIKDNYAGILDESAVYFHIGDLEPYQTLYSSAISATQVQQIDLSSLNAVYDFKRYTQIETAGDISYVEAPYYKGEEFDLIDIDNKDLYLWTDPIAMLSMAKDIRDWLSSTFPDESGIFEEKFKILETDLTNLDAQYQALSTSNENSHSMIRFVTMTSSFGNWQKTYGFQVYPIILSKYGALPNEKQLALIEERIKSDGIKYIVYEPNMTSDMIQLFDRVEEDCGLMRVELSNLSSLTQDNINEGKDYLSIMYENLSVLNTMVESRSGAEAENTNVSADSETEYAGDNLD